jgi:hypothetical protein
MVVSLLMIYFLHISSKIEPCQLAKNGLPSQKERVVMNGSCRELISLSGVKASSQLFYRVYKGHINFHKGMSKELRG